MQPWQCRNHTHRVTVRNLELFCCQIQSLKLNPIRVSNPNFTPEELNTSILKSSIQVSTIITAPLFSISRLKLIRNSKPPKQTKYKTGERTLTLRWWRSERKKTAGGERGEGMEVGMRSGDERRQTVAVQNQRTTRLIRHFLLNNALICYLYILSSLSVDVGSGKETGAEMKQKKNRMFLCYHSSLWFYEAKTRWDLSARSVSHLSMAGKQCGGSSDLLTHDTISYIM